MSDVKIKKAKIKDDLFLEGEYTETLPGHSKKDSKFSCTVPIHDDLKAAFTKLDKHLAILCDEVKTPKEKDFANAEFPGFTVRSFSVGGNDEHEGVTVSGFKEGKYGTVNLNTPHTKWESEDYPFATQLSEDVEACIYEVDQYLFNEKRAPEKQLEMEFDNAVEEGADAAEAE
jgi:hypothetical protein